MEDIWKKFKDETKDHMQKINEFLNGNSNEKNLEPEKPLNILDEKSRALLNETSPNDDLNEMLTVWREVSPKGQIQQVVLESQDKPSRKETYGKMRHLVKEIMEKENLSRAQAYRKAKKRLENSHS